MSLERPHGRPRQQSTKVLVQGPTVEDTRRNRKLAEQIYQAAMGDLARNRWAIPTSPVESSVNLFMDWYDANVTAHKRGARREREILTRLRTVFGPLALTAVTRDTVLEWRTQRTHQVSAATVNREMDVLKHLLAAAVPKYITLSPIARLPRLHTRTPTRILLTPAQERKLLKVLTPENRAILLLALDTLMRTGDIERLRRDDDRGRYLVVQDSKTGYYEVPISTRVRKALDTLPMRGSRFFLRQRGSIAQMFERACRRCGIPYGQGKGVTFHALRHTGASRMLAQKVNPRVVMAIGNWKSLRQLTRYTHPTEREQRAAVELIGRGGR